MKADIHTDNLMRRYLVYKVLNLILCTKCVLMNIYSDSSIGKFLQTVDQIFQFVMRQAKVFSKYHIYCSVGLLYSKN